MKITLLKFCFCLMLPLCIIVSSLSIAFAGGTYSYVTSKNSFIIEFNKPFNIIVTNYTALTTETVDDITLTNSGNGYIELTGIINTLTAKNVTFQGQNFTFTPIANDSIIKTFKVSNNEPFDFPVDGISYYSSDLSGGISLSNHSGKVRVSGTLSIPEGATGEYTKSVTLSGVEFIFRVAPTLTPTINATPAPATLID